MNLLLIQVIDISLAVVEPFFLNKQTPPKTNMDPKNVGFS